MGTEIIIGIDPGTNGGWVSLDWPLNGKKCSAKSGELYAGHTLSADELTQFSSKNKIHMAFIEQQWAGSIANNVLRLARSEGFWMGILHTRAIKTHFVHPNHWRTHFKLHKRPAKYVFAYAKELFGADLPEHCATAALIAAYGAEKFA